MFEQIFSYLKNPKIQKYLVIALVVILAYYLLKKLFSVGSFNTAFQTVQAGSSLTGERRLQIDQIADAVYSSMDGAGTWTSDFKTEMKKINNDAEFVYLQASFGQREDANLAEWIGSEYAITSGVKEDVNSNYQSKSMTSRI
jgi:hypothetical protein